MALTRCLLTAGIMLMLCGRPALPGDRPTIPGSTVDETIARLVKTHGTELSARIERGVRQTAARWWSEDGDAQAFSVFCEAQFLADWADLSHAAARIETTLEQIDGHAHEVRRELLRPLQLDTGPIRPVDRLLAGIDPGTHVDEDLYRSKVAFLALLNFPVHSLSEVLEQGGSWDRETWARSRMMDRFSRRVPAEVLQSISDARTAADQYIAAYNIRLDRLRTKEDESLFPEGTRLISHWGLRDELKSQYPDRNGLERQRLILRVIERIVRQEIPRDVIDNPDLLWEPYSNRVRPRAAAATGADAALEAPREPDVRYARWLDLFHAVRRADPYSPVAPTFIDRRFEVDRQIPEAEVERLLVTLLTSDEFRRTAELIRHRLDRPLEPFDIWYDGFKSRGSYPEAELTRIVSARYPDASSFQRALPQILVSLGFSAPRATWLSERIVVDPSRGAGHAMGAARREDQAHLRTRVGAGGMDYKGYNIAIHELGHNVEQVFSLNAIDHWWINGVPNNAFTEALAFLFQDRDLELLGLRNTDTGTTSTEALDTLWGASEIGGVALVDMAAWRWLYRHPDATPAQLREAVLAAARDVWNRYFAPVFGTRDQEILAIYSHMIAYPLYVADYSLGHIIAFQIAESMKSDEFGQRFEAMARQGRLTPDAWMRGAVGEPISTDALLSAARKTLRRILASPSAHETPASGTFAG